MVARNFESPADANTDNVYEVEITATDDDGNSDAETWTVTVDDVNKAPTDISIDNNNVDENQMNGTVVGIFSSTDPDTGNSHVYSLVPGLGDADNASFQIVGNQLQTNAVLDYEAQNSFSIRVRTTDNGTGNLTYEEVITITVIDQNDTPTDIFLSNDLIDEGLPGSTLVGVLSSTDQDKSDNHRYQLVPGVGDADNAGFSIVGTTLQTNAVLDYDTQNTFSIRIRSTDNGSVPLAYEKAFTINVADQNFAPTDIALSNDNVDENQATGTVVGTYTTVDPDLSNSHGYSLVPGTGDVDNTSFRIVGNELSTNAVFDYETQNTFSIRVRTTDDGTGSLTYEEIFTITINDLNDAPDDISLSNNTVNEGEPVGTLVGLLTSLDQDAGDSHTYSLVAGNVDNVSFQIVGNELHTNEVFDFEAKSSYDIVIRATDSNGATFDKSFVISVIDVNEAPIDISLSNNIILEGEPEGVTIGYLSTTDEDANDDHIYSIVSGTDSLFVIDGDVLIAEASFDFETQSSYIITIRSTDLAGAFVDKDFEIIVEFNPDQELVIPTVFTPDGDDVNDVWTIQNIELYEQCRVIVFSRNGKEIYRSTGYERPWDGTFNSKKLPVDTYFYIIELNDRQNRHYKGFVMIL
jgi:gliding motility-associated-like protein